VKKKKEDLYLAQVVSRRLRIPSGKSEKNLSRPFESPGALFLYTLQNDGTTEREGERMRERKNERMRSGVAQS